jgi:2-keto-3-deoxy-6-phosphogluconate aldolase
MTILQILAAGMAGLDALVYFTADAAGGNDFQTAVQLLQERVALEDAVPLAEVMEAVEGLGLRWGTSDGN